MFEMVLNTPLHHLKTQSFNLSSEKESGSHNNHYENVYDEDCFLVKVLASFENSKNHLDKKFSSINFQYYDKPFPKSAFGQFVLISGIL